MGRFWGLLFMLPVITLAGCTMTPELTTGDVATAVPPTIDAAPSELPVTIAVTRAEYPAPTMTGNPAPPPYPPPHPQPTTPYPEPNPYPYTARTLPTPTPTVAVYPVDDYAAQPGFTRCGGEALTGKLAYFTPDNQLIVLNFDTETAWRSSQTGLQSLSWSPDGNLLLTREQNGRSFLYRPDGLLYDYVEYPVKWAHRGNRLFASSTIWTADDAMSASLVYVESEPGADGRTRAEQVVEIYLPLGKSPNPIHWTLPDPEFPDQYFVLLDWVPQTEWLLFGQRFGGAGGQQTAGFRLLALNVRTGEIIDSGLSLPANKQFDWHPAETGLLVTTNLTNSEIGGMGRLALWRIPENQVTYLLASTPHILAPVWSPDGRYLAYTAFDLSEQFWLEVLDRQTGTAVKQADWGAWPTWSQDGSTIFYLEVRPGEETTQVRTVVRGQGEPLTIAATRPLRGIGLSNPHTVFDYAP